MGEGPQRPQEILFCSKGAAGGSILPELEDFSREAKKKKIRFICEISRLLNVDDSNKKF